MLIVTCAVRLVLAGYGVNVEAGPRKRLSRPRRLPCVVFGHFWSFLDIMTQRMMTSRRKRRLTAGDATRGHCILSHFESFVLNDPKSTHGRRRGLERRFLGPAFT